jgi:hypothetical protein
MGLMTLNIHPLHYYFKLNLLDFIYFINHIH